MKVVIQRVKEASVSIDGKCHSKIANGLLVLLGIAVDDTEEDSDWILRKIVNLRIFNDSNGVMNKSLVDLGGDLLVVSQFTLYASTKKGNRPSYIQSAKPEVAISTYNNFLSKAKAVLNKAVYSGIFGADMQVHLVNDGPVTIIVDSKHRE
ncbi:D-aminoacyl-tRNA deacylase [Winogradskyella aurantiaca]|uniref:D-aminoacyl-tRNA deacylase n=1 Tax=Winogradskyella aurantiaca TaxID=2219558 RepID=UPI000E1CA854|nr:D-aminoacyl-tRNA deacylase [Winogradskyella aurantiaca]